MGHNVNSVGTTLGDNVIDRRFYAMQDQQYNLMALVDERGVVIERYEYSLYGQRQVFRRSDFNEQVMHADFNADGSVNILDLLILNNNYQQLGKTHAQGDANGDGVTDFIDLQLYYGAETGISTADNDPKALAAVLNSTRLYASGVPLCRVGFTGHFHDEATGLVHMRNRDYVPALGRFLTRDPAGDVDGQNMYAGHFALSLGTDATGLSVGDVVDTVIDRYNSIAPSAYRTSDRIVANQLRRLRSHRRLLDAQVKRLGRQVQRMQDRMGNCPFDPSGQLPLAEEIYEGFKGWVNTFYAVNKRLADGYGNARQQAELGNIGTPVAVRGVPAGDPEGVLQKWNNATGKLVKAQSAEVELLDKQIQYLEYAQTGTNTALLLTGAGAITYNVARTGVTQGLKAAAGRFACYATSVAVGFGTSALSSAVIGTLDLNPYAKDALIAGTDFMIGMLTPKFCFPAGTVVWCVDEDGNLVQKKIEEVKKGERVWSDQYILGLT